MTDVVTVLRDARAMLARPGGWCKGRLDRPLNNHTYPARCLMGALYQASPHIDASLRALRAECGRTDLAGFNDLPSTRKRDVLNLLDRAIARAEGA